MRDRAAPGTEHRSPPVRRPTLRVTETPNRPLGEQDAVAELRGAAGTAKKIRDVAAWLLRVTEACDTVTRQPASQRGDQGFQARLLATAIHLREDFTPKQKQQLLSRWEKVSSESTAC